ncbi:MAG: hypothetical protein LW875_05300 [Proteobacteria bacterium]|jgi:hypothetical protein|nr:hypothetical protein [Pseudomonadota bacterium]
MIGDGANWIYNLLSSQELYIDKVYLRYLDPIHQILGLVAVKYFDSPQVALELLLYSYSSFFVLVLFLASAIYFASNEYGWSFITLLLGSSVLLPAAPFSVGIAPIAGAFFLLSLSIYICHPQKKYLLSVLIVLVAFSYEPAASLLVALLIIVLFDSIKRKRLNFELSFLLFICLTIVVLHTLTAEGQNASFFWDSLFVWPDAMRLVGVSALIFFLVCCFVNGGKKLNVFRAFILIGVVLLVVNSFLSYSVPPKFGQISPSNAYLARTTALPLLAVFCLGFYFVPLFSLNRAVVSNTKILSFLIACLIAMDIAISYSWRTGLKQLADLEAVKTGCWQIGNEMFKRSFLDFSIANYSIPHLSFLQQIRSGKKSLETFIEYNPEASFQEMKKIESVECKKIFETQNYLSLSGSQISFQIKGLVFSFARGN